MADNNKGNSFLIQGAAGIAAAVILLLIFMFSAPDNNNNIEENVPSGAEKETHSLEKPDNKPIEPFKKYYFKYTYDFNVKGHINDFSFKVPLPDNDPEKQYISNFKIYPEPSRIINTDKGKIAEYDKSSIDEGNFKIIFEGGASLRTYNIKTAEKINKNISPEKDLSRYLKSEKGIESDDAYIKKIAEGIKGASRKEIAANVYKYLQQHMKYQIISENLGAKQALNLRYGKCTEFAAAMTAILRAKNIPARIVTGNIARKENTPHNWVEVYFNEYGWVTYDPSVLPAKVKIYAPDGSLSKTETRYEVSHDEIQYIKTAVNTFAPYKSEYSIDSGAYGDISLKRYDTIKNILDFNAAGQ